MRRSVFICSNPFQIMVAIILAEQLKCFEQSDIIISDRAADMQNFFKRLKVLNLFKNVYFAKVKSCNSRENYLGYNMRKAKCELFGCTVAGDYREYADYTDIFSLNCTCITNDLASYEQSRGIVPEIHLFEEGFGCYTDQYFHHLFNKNIGRSFVKLIAVRARGIKPTESLVSDLYLFEPDLIKWDSPYRIKKINKPDIQNNPQIKIWLNTIFGYDNDIDLYKQKYIFFEDCQFQDFGDNRDFMPIMNIAETVGKKNILLKLHPRTEKNRFKDSGIETIKKQGMPWEVVVMNMEDTSEHIFITISSSSVVTFSLLFEKKIKVVLLFKALPDFACNINPGILEFLVEYSQKNPEYIFIPNTLEEAYKLLTQI